MTLNSLSKKDLIKISDDVTSAHDLHHINLTKHAIYKTHDADLGEDLVQTTFLKTLTYLRRGGKIVIMRAFLNHILKDLITDEYRKRKPVSLDALLEAGFEPAAPDHERVADMFDGQQVVGLLSKLPQKYQSVLKMRYMQDLSLKEMSLLTGQTTNTISVQSHRGLKKLQAISLKKSAPRQQMVIK